MIRVSPWRLIIAGAVFGTLGVSVAVVARVPGPEDGPVVDALAPSSVAHRPAPPASMPASVLAAASDQTPRPIEQVPAAAPVDAVRRAVVEWERFANGGPLSRLADVFVSEGPQHARFETVAGTTERSGPVSLGLRVVGPARVDGAVAEVDALVAMSTAAFETVASWRFHLVLRDGTWMVWTVEDVTTADPGPPHRLR